MVLERLREVLRLVHNGLELVEKVGLETAAPLQDQEKHDKCDEDDLDDELGQEQKARGIGNGWKQGYTTTSMICFVPFAESS